MADDESGAPLSRRVPGAARSGQGQPVPPVLPESVLNRMQAAIDAEHAQAEAQRQGEPNTEPLARVTASGPPSKHAAQRAASPSGMIPEPVVQERPAKSERIPRPIRAARRPRAEEPLRVTKALGAAEAARAAVAARAAEELRAAEAVRTSEAVRAPDAVQAPEAVRAPEATVAAEAVLAADTVRMPAAEPAPGTAAEPQWPSFPEAPPAEPMYPPPPRAAELPRANSPAYPGQPAPGTIGWLWPEEAALGGGGPRRQRPSRWSGAGRWRYRTATLVALGAVLLAAAGLVIGMALRNAPAGSAASGKPGVKATAQPATGPTHGHGAQPDPGGSAAGAGSRAPSSSPAKPAANPELAPNRAAAASWVAQEVAPGTVVACDAQTCAALKNKGIAAGQEVLVRPNSQSLANAKLVVVTPQLRTAFTKSLGADVPPTRLASWGSGTALVTVQVVYPAGAAAYQTALTKSVQQRMTVGQQLLGTGRVTASPAARSDLTSGAVDPRLLLVIKAMASLEGVAIVGFADSGPGASAGVPLRVMTIAQTDPASSVAGSAYVQAMLKLLQAHASFPAFYHIGQPTMPNGQKVVQVEYAAPSPVSQ